MVLVFDEVNRTTGNRRYWHPKSTSSLSNRMLWVLIRIISTRWCYWVPTTKGSIYSSWCFVFWNFDAFLSGALGRYPKCKRDCDEALGNPKSSVYWLVHVYHVTVWFVVCKCFKFGQGQNFVVRLRVKKIICQRSIKTAIFWPSQIRSSDHPINQPYWCITIDTSHFSSGVISQVSLPHLVFFTVQLAIHKVMYSILSMTLGYKWDSIADKWPLTFYSISFNSKEDGFEDTVVKKRKWCIMTFSLFPTIVSVFHDMEALPCLL